jgi:hypothetical protein
VVTLKVKYADFTLVTRRVTLPQPTDDDGTIREAACGQLDRIDLGRPVRLTGISVSGFAGEAERGQLGLFETAPSARPPADERRRALNAALDALADRFGERAVTRADLLSGGTLGPRTLRDAEARIPPGGPVRGPARPPSGGERRGGRGEDPEEGGQGSS